MRNNITSLLSKANTKKADKVLYFFKSNLFTFFSYVFIVKLKTSENKFERLKNNFLP